MRLLPMSPAGENVSSFHRWQSEAFARYIPGMDLIIEGVPLPGLPEIISAMGVNGADFMWHLADVEASAWPHEIKDGWISGADLIAHWVPHETQFVWGVLDAFPHGPRFEVIDLPFADGNPAFWKGKPLVPQIEGAVFEMVFWDSRAVLLIGLDEEQAASVVRALPGATSLVILPVDFNATYEDNSVPLNRRGTVDALAHHGISLREGMDVVITDTELWVRATVCHRFGVWCAATIGPFHYVAD